MSPTTDRSAATDEDGWRSRWRLSYTRGDWLALAGPSAAVLLQPASAQWSELIASIWEEVLAAGGIEDLLERMAAFRLEAMPSFAALFWGPDGMRSLARGAIRLSDADTGALLLDGAGVQTWTEAALAGSVRVRISTGTSPGATDTGPTLELPLIIGAAGVTDLVVDTADERQVSTATPAGGSVAAPAAGFDGSDSLTDGLDAVDPLGEPVRAAADEAVAAADREAGSGRPGWDESLEGHTLIAPSLPGAPTAPGAPVTPSPSGSATAAFGPVGDAEHEQGHTVLAPHLPGGPVLPVPSRPREVAAVLRPSSGGQVEVDRPVLIGRAPSANRVSSSQLPRLLTVPSPSHDISRTHLQVAPGDGQVLVTDMNSTNGTVVITADGRRLTLEPSAPQPLEPGAVIDLGDGITIAVEPAATEPLAAR